MQPHLQSRVSRSVFMASFIAALSALASGQAAAASDVSAQPAAAYGKIAKMPTTRTIEITSQTRHINVTQLESVQLKLGEQRVNWTFDTLSTRAFPLAAIVPGLPIVPPQDVEPLASLSDAAPDTQACCVNCGSLRRAELVTPVTRCTDCGRTDGWTPAVTPPVIRPAA